MSSYGLILFGPRNGSRIISSKYSNESSGSLKTTEFFYQWNYYELLRKPIDTCNYLMIQPECKCLEVGKGKKKVQVVAVLN
jgi:hypothetical protein